MLMALALLAAIDAVPSSTVSLTRTGEIDRPPVDATPRSLSDVARELRTGRKAVGGFSAVESTVPQSRTVFVPIVEPEPETREPEPEVVPQAQPVYVPTYLPMSFGGHPRTVRHHPRTSARSAASGPTSPSLGRPSAPQPFHLRHGGAGAFRER
jgi:hypothetical protein